MTDETVDEFGYGTDYDDYDDRLTVEQHSRRAQQGETVAPNDLIEDGFMLDDVLVPAQSVQGTDLSRFEPKQTIGAYDKDSDATMSAWIQDNWSGGQLINKHIGGATDQRFRSSNAWTMSSEQLALPPLVEYSTMTEGAEWTGDASPPPTPELWNVSTPLGLLDKAFYYAIGCQVFVALPDVLTSSERGLFYAAMSPAIKLLGAPVNIGAVYGPPVSDVTLAANRPRLYIPLGEIGLARILDDSVIATELTKQAVAVKVWDNRLWMLDINGYLWYKIASDLDPAGTWSTPTYDMRVPRGQVPLDLELFYDRSGNETLFVTTDKQMFAYDTELERLVATELTVNSGRGNNFGFAQWRNDSIFTSSDIAISRYSRDGVKSPMGLDRDDGLDLDEILGQYPNRTILGGGAYSTAYGTERYAKAPRAPYIGHMAGAQNFLCALVGRGTRFDTISQMWESRVSIEVFNNAGWHTIMDKTFRTRVGYLLPGQMIVEDDVGGYRIWFGLIKVGDETGLTYFDEHDGQAVNAYRGDVNIGSVLIPRSDHGPRQQVIATLGNFERRGYIKTGWFTANMEGFDKTWSHFEMTLAQPRGATEVHGKVSVYYRLWEAPEEWLWLGDVDQFGRNVLPFGIEERDDGSRFSRGLTGNGIEFRYDLIGTHPTNQVSPIIASTVLKYIKIPLPGRAWIVTIPLDSINQNGFSPQEMDDMLARKTYEGGFFPMVHQGHTHRVRVAQHQMIEGVGANPFKQATANLVGVSIAGVPDLIPAEESEEG